MVVSQQLLRYSTGMEIPKKHQPYVESRPWGQFEQFTLNAPSTVKLITVNSGEILSLQYHTQRDEFWRVVSGAGEIEIDDAIYPAQAGYEFYIKRGEKHRMKASDAGVLTVLEIAYGDFDENDIVRLEDKYKRA